MPAHRVPRAVRLVHGTDRADRRVRDQPRSAPTGRPPAPPAWLDSYGKAKWRELVPGLAERQLLTGGPLSLLELLCEAYGEWRRAAAVTRGGVSYRKKQDAGGYARRPTPEVAVAVGARKEYASLLERYNRLLELPPSGSTADGFTQLLDKRSGGRARS